LVFPGQEEIVEVQAVAEFTRIGHRAKGRFSHLPRGTALAGFRIEPEVRELKNSADYFNHSREIKRKA